MLTPPGASPLSSSSVLPSPYEDRDSHSGHLPEQMLDYLSCYCLLPCLVNSGWGCRGVESGALTEAVAFRQCQEQAQSQ